MNVKMTQDQMASRIVRYGDLVPCKTAFIDTHTPGSDQKENFSIIGVGVSEAADQHVHIKDTPGFNIGGAGQPPRCTNSLHDHRTAEVFIVITGRWRFFWGRQGDAGDVVLNEGDIFNIPTGIFRGFENVGNDYGTIRSILGGDDAGGGVIWSPEVRSDAIEHGLVLGEDGKLYDSAKNEFLPQGVAPMPDMAEEQLSKMGEPTTAEVVPNYVARYWDLIAMADRQPAKVLGPDARLKDRPGFEVDFISNHSISAEAYEADCHEILMPVHGHWKVDWSDGETTLAAGDTMAIPPGVMRSIQPANPGQAAMYRVRNTEDPAGPTVKF